MAVQVMKTAFAEALATRGGIVIAPFERMLNEPKKYCKTAGWLFAWLCHACHQKISTATCFTAYCLCT